MVAITRTHRNKSRAAPGGHNLEVWWHVKHQTAEEKGSFGLTLCPFRFRKIKRRHWHCVLSVHIGLPLPWVPEPQNLKERKLVRGEPQNLKERKLVKGTERRKKLSFLPYFFLFIIFWLWYPG